MLWMHSDHSSQTRREGPLPAQAVCGQSHYLYGPTQGHLKGSAGLEEVLVAYCILVSCFFSQWSKDIIQFKATSHRRDNCFHRREN